jgi:hypothetical protein
MESLLGLANIAAGLLLALATLDKWDGDRNIFNKIAEKLVPFQTVIGGALIVLTILIFWNNWIYNTVSILGGILLLTHVFSKVPALEASLRQLSAKLMPFKAIIGIALIVFGLLNIF